ncbi:hypothetical protein LCGC14_1829570 [marine sediment metagenome]|uniref:Uncharacterized protein n=2 Tax=marine sediment metagenome TaxID=412755 RepID=A0A0F9GGH0_9ZZZZ
MLFDYTADQAKYMRDTKLKDQFGRLWHCTVDKKTGQPTGCPNPIGWVDPLNTPNSYLTVPHWEDGSARTDEVLVDFEGWIADVEQNNTHWDMAITVMGEKKFPLASSEDRDGWAENPHLTKEAGPKPFPSRETLIQAKNGDRKLLGLDKDVRTGATNPIDMTYQEFVAENRRDEFDKTRTMVAIGVLWKEHKDNLAMDEMKKSEEPEKVEA